MTTTNDAIIALHNLFAELAGRAEPVRFHERSWGEVLRCPEYNWDAAAVERDLRLLIQYLRVQIRDDKRNIGALKLRNFLQVDQWFADLAEAQAWQKTCRTARSARPNEALQAPDDRKPVTDAEREEIAKRVKEQAANLTSQLTGSMRVAE